MEMARPRQQRMSDFMFMLMALEHRLRARPQKLMEELVSLGVQPGMQILDFGCGPGRYTLPAAALVGAEGTVYAIDVHPLAIQLVEDATSHEGFANVRTMLSDCATGLMPESVDLVFLFHTLHDVEDKGAVLSELRRVLKPKGRLLYDDYSLNGQPLASLMRENDFRPWSRSGLLSFVKC